MSDSLLDPSLRDLFIRYPGPVQPRTAPLNLGNAGGLSGANLWRFESEIGSLLVRAWPISTIEPGPLERMQRWLSSIRDLPFIPAPIPCEDGSTLIRLRGRFWELTPWMTGSPDVEMPPESAHVESAFRALATFHERLSRQHDSCDGPSLGLIRRRDELVEWMRGGFDQVEAILHRSPPDLRRDLALRWLTLARSFAPRLRSVLDSSSRQVLKLQPCIRDARRDHFLFEGRDLTGIVDFGAMDVDCVAGDLARLIVDWFDEKCSLEFEGHALAAYEQIRPLEPTERALIPIFRESAIFLGPGHWVRWNFIDGRRFEDPGAALNGLRRGLERFERSIERSEFSLTTGTGARWVR